MKTTSTITTLIVALGCWGCAGSQGRAGSGDVSGAGGVPDATFVPLDSGTVDAAPDVGEADEDVAVPDGAVCPPSLALCTDTQTQTVCADDGSGWSETACPADQRCWQGMCSEVICSPGLKAPECATPTDYLRCNPLGTSFEPAPCGAGLTCYEGACVDYLCQPGAVACVGFGQVQRCEDDGSGWKVVETCEKGGTCFEGTCISACEVDLKAATYTGCEYFAVDLDNIEGGEFEPVALVVSVPNAVDNATVTITDMSNGQALSAAQLGALSLVVASGSLGVFRLPLGQDFDGTGKWKRSFHVKTSTPATVHQFNPLNGEGVYTNDASLLLPSSVGGTEYYVMSWPMRQDAVNTLRGFATVVATEPGQTVVTVTPRADVVEGAGGVGFIPAGTEVDFVLDQGEALNLETAGGEGADLTGTRIVSSQRVTVFGGHECANVPLGVNACDHLEQQLIPVSAWGNRYVADVFAKRSPAQFDVFRIMAGGTDVLVETNPPQPGYEKFLLQPGTSVTLSATSSFEIKASGRIMVGHFMTGSSYPGHVKSCGHTGIGDPAFTLVVPTQQFLKEYTVLTPPGYVQSFLNVIAPSGAELMLDGQPLVQGLSAVAPGLDWGTVQIPVGEGVHTVTAKKRFGLTAYGYDCDVSYAYPGGLRLLNLLD